MSNNDNVLNNKVSNHIQTQLPEFIQADHPVFSKFVKFLLNKFKEATIVSLTGLIIGSLPELYPHKLENLSTVFFM